MDGSRPASAPPSAFRDSEMAAHVHSFRESGYALVPGALDASTVSRWRAAVDRTAAVVRSNPEDHSARYTHRTAQEADTWGVSHIFDPSLYDPVYAEVFEHPGVMSFVHSVLGEELRFWTAHALWEPKAVDYELNWHKDNMENDRYAPDGRSTHVQFNICLLDDDCFRLVPGSHRRPLTEAERDQVDAMGTGPLPGEVSVSCRAGDVLFMNHHALHRGSASAGVPRRTLHMNVQAADEPTGGHTSWRFMREEGYLDRMPPSVRTLMEATIAWDDAHPLPLAETMRRRRASRQIKGHEARVSEGVRR
ncbi:phytanoyl-CoA dioxygenase family protein [Streptomyces sp. NPDC005438]|uniref:phytanoyl-CoA dioxygenase family protein n=1 Tax=Streptomyces sp. NPDC005438 TaxID=3156880 RepID=UPI0033A10714